MTYLQYWRLGLAGLIAALAIIMIINPALALSRSEVKRIVVEEAENSTVPPALALAVAKVESDFNPSALSTAGARGVMQIMPKTAKDEFGVEKDELWKARLNIQLGIDYLAKLRRQYGGNWELALSHYNGGTLKGRGRYAEPHSYTKLYVRMVKRWQQRYSDQHRIWTVASSNSFIDDDRWEEQRKQNVRRQSRIRWNGVWESQRSYRWDKKWRSYIRDKNYRRNIWDRQNWKNNWRLKRNSDWRQDFGSNLEDRRLRATGTLDDFTIFTFGRSIWNNG